MYIFYTVSVCVCVCLYIHDKYTKYTHIHYIAKSIGTPSNERFDCFSNLHQYKS